MSESIFLEPVAPVKRVVFIQLRNTSDKQNFNIEQELKAAIRAKGYRVIDDPEKAHYKLLAQILNVSKTDPTAAEAALDEGYGGAGGILAGGTAGALVGGALGDSEGALIGAGIGALIGGIAETVSSASTKDVMFVAITDIQVSEKTRGGVTGRREAKVAAGQGVGGKERQTFTEKVNEKRYRTRVVSTANKVNLEYEEAAPALTSGLV